MPKIPRSDLSSFVKEGNVAEAQNRLKVLSSSSPITADSEVSRAIFKGINTIYRIYQSTKKSGTSKDSKAAQISECVHYLLSNYDRDLVLSKLSSKALQEQVKNIQKSISKGSYVGNEAMDRLKELVPLLGEKKILESDTSTIWTSAHTRIGSSPTVLSADLEDGTSGYGKITPISAFMTTPDSDAPPDITSRPPTESAFKSPTPRRADRPEKEAEAAPTEERPGTPPVPAIAAPSTPPPAATGSSPDKVARTPGEDPGASLLRETREEDSSSYPAVTHLAGDPPVVSPMGVVNHTNEVDNGSGGCCGLM